MHESRGLYIISQYTTLTLQILSTIVALMFVNNFSFAPPSKSNKTTCCLYHMNTKCLGVQVEVSSNIIATVMVIIVKIVHDNVHCIMGYKLWNRDTCMAFTIMYVNCATVLIFTCYIIIIQFQMVF